MKHILIICAILFTGCASKVVAPPAEPIKLEAVVSDTKPSIVDEAKKKTELKGLVIKAPVAATPPVEIKTQRASCVKDKTIVIEVIKKDKGCAVVNDGKEIWRYRSQVEKCAPAFTDTVVRREKKGFKCEVTPEVLPVTPTK